MANGLNILPKADLDFVSLGALIHRLDPGIIPFRKATECLIHVSGGEFNCAANLADCFGLKTGIATSASSVLGLYVILLSPTFPSVAGHLISASLLLAPSAILAAKVIIPETGKPLTLGRAVPV